MELNIANLLNKVLKESNDTIDDMADKLGISVAYLYSIGNGYNLITGNIVDKLVSLYNVSEEDEYKLRTTIVETSSKRLQWDSSVITEVLDRIMFDNRLNISGLANNLGVGYTYLYNIRRGRYPLSLSLYMKLKDKYKISNEDEIRLKKVYGDFFHKKYGENTGYINKLSNRRSCRTKPDLDYSTKLRNGNILMGDIVKNLRVTNDLSAKEIANRIGVSLSTYVEVESNRRKPTEKFFELLKSKFPLTEDELKAVESLNLVKKPLDYSANSLCKSHKMRYDNKVLRPVRIASKEDIEILTPVDIIMLKQLVHNHSNNYELLNKLHKLETELSIINN